MEFQSPRFTGDPDLLRILNDPDTGTEKLGPGSPLEAVTRLQRALFDLGWTLRIDPPFLEESAFLIGAYGPVTTKTVLVFKTHYGIHFPPDEPTGFVDGFAGPRTLMALDSQCVHHDASAEAVEAKAEELRALGHDVVLDDTAPTTIPILQSSGVMRSAHIDGELGGVWHSPSVGAFEVHGPIAEAYVGLHHAGGRLGFPITDIFDEDVDLQRSLFEHGTILHHRSTGQIEVDPPS